MIKLHTYRVDKSFGISFRVRLWRVEVELRGSLHLDRWSLGLSAECEMNPWRGAWYLLYLHVVLGVFTVELTLKLLRENAEPAMSGE